MDHEPKSRNWKAEKTGQTRRIRHLPLILPSPFRRSEDGDSEVIDNTRWINAGTRQGWAIVKPENSQNYEIRELRQALSDSSLLGKNQLPYLFLPRQKTADVPKPRRRQFKGLSSVSRHQASSSKLTPLIGRYTDLLKGTQDFQRIQRMRRCNQIGHS